jgi:membrane associated rhomboid family serine protease
MNAAEREKLALVVLVRLRAAITTLRAGAVAHDPLHVLLIERTQRLVVTPALIAICVWVWFAMLFGGEGAAIAWGANYTPRTTNGEWRRLVTYSFVHAGLFHLLATIAALLPLGMIVERLVGRIAFAAVFFAAAIVAGAVSLWTEPATTTTLGASGGVFGLIGLLITVIFYGYARDPRLPISRIAAKRLAVGCGIFVLYNLASDDLGMASEMAGLATGVAAGLVIALGVAEEKPPVLRAAIVTVVSMVIAFSVAQPFSGTIDARPAIAQIADVESNTAAEYAKAVAEFTQGRMSGKALVQVIQGKILPALEADRARVNALHGVPREQTPLVTTAREYFELREQSWRRRIQGIQASSNPILKDADRAERTALGAFSRLQQDLTGQP